MHMKIVRELDEVIPNLLGDGGPLVLVGFVVERDVDGKRIPSGVSSRAEYHERDARELVLGGGVRIEDAANLHLDEILVSDE